VWRAVVARWKGPRVVPAAPYHHVWVWTTLFGYGRVGPYRMHTSAKHGEITIGYSYTVITNYYDHRDL